MRHSGKKKQNGNICFRDEVQDVLDLRKIIKKCIDCVCRNKYMQTELAGVHFSFEERGRARLGTPGVTKTTE